MVNVQMLQAWPKEDMVSGAWRKVCVTPAMYVTQINKGVNKSWGNLEIMIEEETLRISCGLMSSSICEGYSFFAQIFFS